MPVIKVHIAKANKDLEKEFNDFPPDIKLYIIEQGLGKLLNAATAKETKATTPDDATREANAFALAEKKLQSLQEGKLVSRARKSDSKVPAVVRAEAMRQAKLICKAKIKAANQKITAYTPKAITEWSTEYLTNHPELIAQAQAAVDAANQMAATAEADVSSIPVDPTRVAANEAKKAAARAATEAKNAGKPGPQKSTVATRAKPGKATSLPMAPKRAPADLHATH